MVTIPTQNQAEQLQQADQGPQGRAGFDGDRWAVERLADELEAEEESFKPLTRVEVERIRAANPPASVIRVLGTQVLTCVVVAGLARVLTGQDAMGWSALYGGLAVWIPEALFARGLQRQQASGHAG